MIMLSKVIGLFVIACSVDTQFVIHRGKHDVFRNLTSCTETVGDYCYAMNAVRSPLDKCVCRCKDKFPMYRNPDVSFSGGRFKSKGSPGCVWHSNHRYECFHIRKLGEQGSEGRNDGALEFNFDKPSTLNAYTDYDLESCSALETSIKFPEDDHFKVANGLLSASRVGHNQIQFKWTKAAARYDGALIRGVFQNCAAKDILTDSGRCFVGKITGVYNGNCTARSIDDECCIFPFTYKGKTYYSCTSDYSKDPWCAVRLRFDNDPNWWKNCLSTSSSSTMAFDSTLASAVPTDSVTVPLTSSAGFSKVFSSTSATPVRSETKTITHTAGSSSSLRSSMVFSSTLETSVLTKTITITYTSTSSLGSSSPMVFNGTLAEPPHSETITISHPSRSGSSSSIIFSSTSAISVVNETIAINNASELSTSFILTNVSSFVEESSFLNRTATALLQSSLHTVKTQATFSLDKRYNKSHVITSSTDLFENQSPSEHRTKKSVSGSRSKPASKPVSASASKSGTATLYAKTMPEYESKPSSSEEIFAGTTITPAPPKLGKKESGSSLLVLVVAIVVCIMVLIIAVSCGICLCIRKRKRRKQTYSSLGLGGSKRSGTPAQQSVSSLSGDSPRHENAIHVEDPIDEEAETEFTIPESPNVSKGKAVNYEPTYLTFKL